VTFAEVCCSFQIWSKSDKNNGILLEELRTLVSLVFLMGTVFSVR